MSKTTFSVTVSDGRGGSKKETRKSAHPYVACVVLTYGAAFVASEVERRAGFEAELVEARADFAARTAALGGMTVAVAEATYRAENDAFWKLSDADREAAIVKAGGDLNVAAGLTEDGPCGLCRASGRVAVLVKRLREPLPVAGEQVAVSWHSTRDLASKARDEKDARRAGCARAADDRYSVRTDIGAA